MTEESKLRISGRLGANPGASRLGEQKTEQEAAPAGEPAKPPPLKPGEGEPRMVVPPPVASKPATPPPPKPPTSGPQLVSATANRPTVPTRDGGMKAVPPPPPPAVATVERSGKLAPIVNGRRVKPEIATADVSLAYHFAKAWTYPFRGMGILWLLLAPLSVAVRIGSFWGEVLVAGYCLAYLFKMVNGTKYVDEGVPECPLPTSTMDDIVRPILLMLCMLVSSAAPMIFYYLNVTNLLPFDLTFPVPLEYQFYVFAAMTAAYLPMGFMSIAITDGLVGAHPGRVFTGMFQVGPGYIVTVLLTLAFLVLPSFVVLPEDDFWLKIGIIMGVRVAEFYLLAVIARMLGVLYQRYSESLGWTKFKAV